jgi:hypothetical protein
LNPGFSCFARPASGRHEGLIKNLRDRRDIIGIDQITDGDDQNKEDPEKNRNHHPVLGGVGFLIIFFHVENLGYSFFPVKNFWGRGFLYGSSFMIDM